MSTNTKSSSRNKHSDLNNAQSVDITKEEFSRISDALKNEEFRKLFLDYCEEIQDPSNRQRFENEIKQLEAERGVEVTFINPEPGFVIKTSVDGSLKCFVNVAKSSEVAKPTSEACVNSETGTRGLNWAIPLTQAGPRDDLDANGKRCRVFDVVFHPDALYLSGKNSAFHKCLVDTALDAVEREYKVSLDRTNLKFPNIKFKGVARPAVIRKLATNGPPEAYEAHPLDSIYPAKPTKNSTQPKVIPLKTKSTEKPEYTIPNYIIKHHRDVDLSEFTNELDAKLNVTIPHELVIEIELPLLNSTAECQLDVTSKSLYFLSEKLGAKYRLKLDLPQIVDDKMGKARFASDTRRLCISLPVMRRSDQRDVHDALFHLHREDSGVESDMRDEVNSNSESPVEELSDGFEEDTLNSAKEKESSAIASKQNILKQGAFLKSSIHYQFPSKFDCNVLDNIMSLVLHVRNVQPESISVLKTEKSVHLQFMSVGSGYYPTHYAFYLLFPSGSECKIISVEPEACENNVVLNISLAETSENINNFLVGLDSNDLKEYTVQGKFPVLHDSRQRKKIPSISQNSLSSSLDISIERSDCEKSIEIEIKPRDQYSICVANTTEDEESQNQQQGKKMNKKQKKKNKKRRSLSESTYDDIKAYQKNQHELEVSRQTNQSDCRSSVERSEISKNISEKNEQTGIAELTEMVTRNISASMIVPTTQQRKQRSYSECRHSVVSSDGLHSYKGILKHYSRYDARPSISDSSSSIDDCMSLSCSAEACTPNSLHFSQSFSDIPEENVNVELSESCKKTVRFSDVIRRQVFRLHSSILGQRKKNQKRRIQKQRALQRRLSEGDSVDYEDIKPSSSVQSSVESYFGNGKSKIDSNSGKLAKPSQHDSGLDLSQGKNNNNDKSSKNGRQRFESESSSDVDSHKTSMMFVMEM